MTDIMNAPVLHLTYGTSTYTNAANSLSRLATWQRPSNAVVDAVEAAEAEGVTVAAETQYAAFVLLTLVCWYPPPDITVEPTGEISFEWYRDQNNIAVLTVDGYYLRWAAMLGPDAPVSDKTPFDYMSTALPTPVVDAINNAS